ncbi:response regulator [Gymnodinialimonas ceratoperidinii]|uniref:Response regulator n=1 Tax=Gymnodinialimonas ceratoperidinii TaxID=2856823 RepID=A0A8F6YDW1_9RHOB|nr:response regulator [Gymnodinialimonas ceratoperidinii]QXT40930.1 response regulator [Gymnodinialimonas ceratoperidinii]
MDDRLAEFDLRPQPTAERPLLGVTILVVEDSRYASEAIRLMSLRSGARLRRADCLASAERHLNVYSPTVAIIDLGLPDGSGLDLIASMAATKQRVQVILGTSGAEREAAEAAVLASGADGFIPKPVSSVAAYQEAILAHLPHAQQPNGPRVVTTVNVDPDPLALREDLSHAMDLLALERPPVGYLRRFLIGVARGVKDSSLEDHAARMSETLGAPDRAALRAILSGRIQAVGAVV